MLLISIRPTRLDTNPSSTFQFCRWYQKLCHILMSSFLTSWIHHKYNSSVSLVFMGVSLAKCDNVVISKNSKNGKNFLILRKVLCYNFFPILQDHVTGNGPFGPSLLGSTCNLTTSIDLQVAKKNWHFEVVQATTSINLKLA